MANGAPTVSNGLVISGVTTTSDIRVGTGITFTTAGNGNFVGIITASAGINVTSGDVTVGGKALATTGKAIAMAMVFG